MEQDMAMLRRVFCSPMFVAATRRDSERFQQVPKVDPKDANILLFDIKVSLFDPFAILPCANSLLCRVFIT